MKKLLLILVVTILFTSCRKETPVVTVDETLNPVFMNVSIDTVNSITVKVN
jgi:uncharacterized lipoprotein YajG